MISRTDIEDMTDAQDETPMRIYLKPGLTRQAGGYPATLTFPDHPKAIEYVRSDLARPSGDERVVQVIFDLAAHLAAAISLLERGSKAAKKAVPSNKMFDQMLVDYRRSLERGRAALAAMDTPKGGGDE